MTGSATEPPTKARHDRARVSPSAETTPTPVGQQRDIVVVGASAGGVEVLKRLALDLPADLPAAIVVVLHVLASGRSLLPEILARSGALPAVSATDGQAIAAGHIYVAPPDRHVLFEGRVIRLNDGPRNDGHRPSIDVLFSSAAEQFGHRVVGVILSGMLRDGSVGMRKITDSGGVTVVQEAADALFPAMPLSAIAATEVDRIVPARGLADTICELLAKPLPVRAESPSRDREGEQR